MKGNVRRIINIITTIILILIIALVVAIFVIRLTGNIPSLFGYKVFRVRSDSMSPTLMVDDIILDKTVKQEDIHNGDIITYKCLSGDLAGETITHRVVEEPVNNGGTYYYRTKGDKEGAKLDDPISFDQVQGKYLNKIPWLDKVYTFFLSPYGLITFILIIMVLFGYEMISLILTYRSIDIKDDDYYEPKQKKKSKKRK